MNLQQIIDRLNLTVLTESQDFAGIRPTGGYSSDLLSCVMAGAKKGHLWITLQAHLNIVAVAALNEVAAIIITENAQPDTASIAKANQQHCRDAGADRDSIWQRTMATGILV